MSPEGKLRRQLHQKKEEIAALRRQLEKLRREKEDLRQEVEHWKLQAHRQAAPFRRSARRKIEPEEHKKSGRGRVMRAATARFPARWTESVRRL